MWALVLNVGVTFLAFAVVGFSVWSAYHSMLEREIRANRLNNYVRTLGLAHEHEMDVLNSAVFADIPVALPGSEPDGFLKPVVAFLQSEQAALPLNFGADQLGVLNQALLAVESQVTASMVAGDRTGARSLMQNPAFIDAQGAFHRQIRTALAIVRDYGEQGNVGLSRNLMWISIFAIAFCVILVASWIRLINLMKQSIAGWREAELELREGEVRYRSLIDTMPQAVLIIHEQKTVFCNPAAAMMLGYPNTKSLVGVAALSRISERDHAELTKFIEASCAGKLNEDASLNLTMVRIDQEEFPAEIYARSILFNGVNAIQIVAANIADRQRAEVVLRESEARFRNLADNAPVLIWMAGAGRHTFYFNKTWLKFTGRPLSQEYGLGWQQQLHPDDSERCLAVYKVAFSAQRPFTVEYRLRHADGTYHWLLDSGAPRFTSDGVFTGFIGSCTDITDRRIAEEAMRGSEHKFRELADLLPQTIFEIDLTGWLTFVNRYAMEMFGFSRADFEHGLNAFQMVSPQDLDVVQARFARILSGERLGSNEYQMRRKDGTVFPALIDSVRVEEDGRPVGARGIIMDISNQKRVEHEIRLLSRAVDSSPDGVLIADLDGNVTYVNDGLLAISHRKTKAELLGKNLSEIADQDSANWTRAELFPILASGKPWSGEVTWRRTDGTVVDLELSCSAIPDENGHPNRLLANLRDISQRKQSEHRIARLNDCLLSFGSDPAENINRLTALCGEAMNATCAMYNCLDGCELVSIGKWHTPNGLRPSSPKAGHLCYDVITQPGDDLFIARDLLNSPYAESDPNVRRWELKTYIGHPVKRGVLSVGSLCVVYQSDYAPSPEDMALMGIIASAIGVEEVRKHEQELLSRAEERFRTSVENMLDPFSILSSVRDEHGKIIDFQCDYINEAGCVHLKRPRDQLVGHRLLEVFPWQKDIGLFNAYCHTVEFGEPYISDTIHFHKDVDGKTVVVSFDVSATRMGDGVTTSWRDVSARLIAEESVQQKSRELETVFSVLPDMYFRMNRESVIMDYRAGSEQKLYVSPEVFLGHKLAEVLPPEIAAKITTGIEAALNGNSVVTVAYTLPLNGVEINFEARIVPHGPDDVVAFVRDTSEYGLTMPRETVADHLWAQHAQKIEHDLREPLELLAEYSALIRQRYAEQLGDDAGTMLAALTDSTAQIRTLVQTLCSLEQPLADPPAS
jgi:PAS domain S-box-containing protein